MRSHARQRKHRRAPEAPQAHRRQPHQDRHRDPAPERTQAVQPLPKPQPQHIQHRDHRQGAHRKQEVIRPARRQVGPMPRGKQEAPRPEVQHGREVRQVAHPVRPRRQKSREVPKRPLRPDVKPALLRVPRRELQHTRRQRHEKESARSHPDHDRARPRSRRRRNPPGSARPRYRTASGPETAAPASAAASRHAPSRCSSRRFMGCG